MTKETMVYYWNSPNKSGYDYIEVDHVNKEFTTGNSASHEGHNVNNIKLELKSRKDLKSLITNFTWLEFDHKETLR